MLLITITRIVNGYRIIAAISCCATFYHWCLYRNGQPLDLPVQGGGSDHVIHFDLKEPLAPGFYQLSVIWVNDKQPTQSPNITATVLIVKSDPPSFS
ncbi:MAG: hypothetical protein R3C14_31215 [Caldilineaceae bacterium]